MINVRIIKIYFLLIVSFLGGWAYSKTVYFVGAWMFFDIDTPPEYGKKPFLKFKQQLDLAGYACKHTSAYELQNLILTRNDLIFCLEITQDMVYFLSKKSFPTRNLILIHLESPIVSPLSMNTDFHKLFGKIYTWNEAWVDNKKYFKLNYYAFDWLDRPQDIEFEQKKLLTLLSGNKKSSLNGELYSARKRIIDFFESNNSRDFDFYGPYWDVKTYRNYAGEAGNRIDCMAKYKFCVSFENVYGYPGYLTEKILNCFWSKTVPIYYGDPYVNNYIPSDCFIDAKRFINNPNDLYYFLQTIDKKKHLEYLENIERFVNSEDFLKFKHNAFADKLKEAALN